MNRSMHLKSNQNLRPKKQSQRRVTEHYLMTINNMFWKSGVIPKEYVVSACKHSLSGW